MATTSTGPATGADTTGNAPSSGTTAASGAVGSGVTGNATSATGTSRGRGKAVGGKGYTMHVKATAADNPDAGNSDKSAEKYIADGLKKQKAKKDAMRKAAGAPAKKAAKKAGRKAGKKK